MAKQLVVEGFVIRPIVHILELEGDIPTIEARPLGEIVVKASEASTWVAEQWPAVWTEIKDQIAQQWEEEANAAIAAKRKARPRRGATPKSGRVT